MASPVHYLDKTRRLQCALRINNLVVGFGRQSGLCGSNDVWEGHIWPRFEVIGTRPVLFAFDLYSLWLIFICGHWRRVYLVNTRHVNSCVRKTSKVFMKLKHGIFYKQMCRGHSQRIAVVNARWCRVKFTGWFKCVLDASSWGFQVIPTNCRKRRLNW